MKDRLQSKASHEEPILVQTERGLALVHEEMELLGDFSKMLFRVKNGKLSHEMLVKAAKIKGMNEPLIAVDATAGLGEDSFLLAAAGFTVYLFECNPVIVRLLQDALDRGRNNPDLCEIVERMHLVQGDSVEGIPQLSINPDIVLLDPMFPAKQKNAISKKKLQMIQHLEKPCDDERDLMRVACEANPRKIVVKRPLKGPFLAGEKPSYSLKGKTIRYDCYVFARD